MKRGKATLALILLASLFLLPSLSAAGSKRTAPLKVGVLCPLSGPFAPGGKSFLRSVTLAAEEINEKGGVLGRPILLVTGDSEGKVGRARNEALRLVDSEGVKFLIGAYLSEETLGVVEVAAERKVLLLVPISATERITGLVRENPDRYSTVFRTGFSISRWAEMIARFISAQGSRKPAFLGTAIRWNRELAEKLEEVLSRQGIKLIIEDFYSPRRPVIKPILLRLALKKPDLIILGDPGKNSIQAVREMEELGLKTPILSVGGTLADERVAKDLSPKVPLYALAAAYRGASPEADRYFDAFRKKYGYFPSGYSDTLPGDALRILAGALQKAREWSPKSVASLLEKGTFPGVSGAYSFDESHQAEWGTPSLSGVVVRWEGSRFVPLKPEK